MDTAKKPLLSIGIIFKNEIRCLERCVKSLEPLRKAVPCELIMADTGSEDGSREIAARYADILIDFPWINDFSAARNAAMDRASGKWYLSIDADEWLDGDFDELVSFLRTAKADLGVVVLRNHYAPELDGEYTDNLLTRLVCMSTGLRYHGRIHECIPAEGRTSLMLANTILHHDGYMGLREESGKAKIERNRSLIRAALEEKPEDLRLLMSYIDCSRYEKDGLDYIRRACALVEEKKPDWKLFGPPIFRHAVNYAHENHLPELEAWIQRAVEWFPNSFFTTIDVAYAAFGKCWAEKDYAGCVHWGEVFLQASEELKEDRGDQQGLLFGSLLMGGPRWRWEIQTVLAIASLKTGDSARALELLEGLDCTELEPNHAGNAALLLRELHETSEIDTAPLVSRLYDGLCRPEPSEARRDERRTAFIRMASAAFDPEVRKSEREEAKFRRPSYTAFLPLSDRCDLGRGAAILGAENAETAASYLEQVEKWDELPAPALEHAMALGVAFPLENKAMTLEEMDGLSGHLARKDGPIVELAIRAADSAAETGWQSMIWARELALAAIQSDCWPETDRAMDLCRAFVKIESTTLPRYYGAEVLNEKNILVLPPLHRFGWYCVRAFEALDAGKYQDYLRLLRAGLTACPSMKGIVEFLASNTPEIQEKMDPSPELLSLAEQVRTLLASFAPGDPALEAIRSSEAYQKVAHLIEDVNNADNLNRSASRNALNPEQFKNNLNSYQSMSEMLKNHGYHEILNQVAALGNISLEELECHPMGGYSKGMTSGAYRFVLQDLLKNVAQYDWLYSRLEDETSRMVYTNLIRYRLVPADAFIKAACDSVNPQYFDKNIISCDSNEVFVDCGACTGDSAERYIHQYGTYKHIYSYEPSPENIDLCRRNLEKYPNITIKQCGVGETSAVLTMDGSGASSTFMRQRKGPDGCGIPIVSLDEDIQEKITYCKMDIEGFEIPALLGAKRHIQNDFPKLAICVYHIVTDIWEIPKLIDELRPGYRFYIRHYDPIHNWETVIYAIPETDK